MFYVLELKKKKKSLWETQQRNAFLALANLLKLGNPVEQRPQVRGT